MGSVVRSIKNLNLSSKLKSLFDFAVSGFSSKRRSRLGVWFEKFDETNTRYYRTSLIEINRREFFLC